MHKDLPYGFRLITYPDGITIPTIVMGGGNVQVISMKRNQLGFASVAFAPLDTCHEVGTLENITDDLKVTEIAHQITFDNPASVDVVITALENVKKQLVMEASDATS